MAVIYLARRDGKGWTVKKNGEDQHASVHDTKYAAWAETKRLARGAQGEAILQGYNGRIATKNIYNPNFLKEE